MSYQVRYGFWVVFLIVTLGLTKIKPDQLVVDSTTPIGQAVDANNKLIDEITNIDSKIDAKVASLAASLDDKIATKLASLAPAATQSTVVQPAIPAATLAVTPAPVVTPAATQPAATQLAPTLLLGNRPPYSSQNTNKPNSSPFGNVNTSASSQTSTKKSLSSFSPSTGSTTFNTRSSNSLVPIE